MQPNHINNNAGGKQLDSYSMLIVSKYFQKKPDFINVVCVNSKFQETTEKLRFNPIPITSLKLFPKMQTQYLYDKNDKQLKNNQIQKYEIWYEVNYEEYIKLIENNTKCHYIKYTLSTKSKVGYIIPNGITNICNKCFENSAVKSIKIPSSVTTIGEECFCECKKLTNIILPLSIHSLPSYCFSNCLNLKSITLPLTISSIKRGCFYKCVSLTSISLQSLLHSLPISCFVIAQI